MKTNIQLDGRFAGILGKEYEKLIRSMPHYSKMQVSIARRANRALPSPVKTGKIRLILDLGCGTGLTTLAMCNQTNYATIVGVDKETTMLKQYRRNVMKAREGNPTENGVVVSKPIHGDALVVLKGIKTGSFDAVISGFFLHNLTIELRAKILKEIARILRPGGIFVNGDKIALDNMNLHNEYLLRQLTKFMTTYTAPEDAAYCLGWIEHYIQDNREGIKYTESEVRSSLEAAGFGKIRITDRHCMEAVASAIKL